MPFITYNGIDHADSQFCIEILSTKFNKNLNKSLDQKQVAIARCVLKTCEESLRWCVVIHRFVYAVNQFKNLNLKKFYFYNQILENFN